MIFALFAGSCNEPCVYDIAEFESVEDATEAAYDCAIEDYQSYEGLHGLPDRAMIMDNPEEYGLSEDYLESELEDVYMDAVESWIQYWAQEIHDLDELKEICENYGFDYDAYSYLFEE